LFLGHCTLRSASRRHRRRTGGAPGCQTLPARNQADIPSLANAGLALSKQQHYREAADCYRKALSIEPKLREVQLNLGLAEFKLGDFKAALGPLGAVLAIDPRIFRRVRCWE